MYPITAARTYEQQLPWLWRFWLKVPNRGEMVIFDHSWYGRVLQDRVERRSEEHTSELQSLRHLVCRLLLEKKNTGDSPPRCRDRGGRARAPGTTCEL